MTIQKRRNSLFKSSISIRSISKSVQKFSDGLLSSTKNADEIIKTTREKNLFKSKLTRKDSEFFRKRQENIRRKDREDELEASSVQGVPKTQGTILARSTRGFLGRMLDFLGVLLIGWAIQNLPKIISGVQGLIKRISSVTGILGLFIEGVQNIIMGIGSLIQNTLSGLLRFDFDKDKNDIDKGLEEVQQGLLVTRNELVQSANEFSKPINEEVGLPTDVKEEEESGTSDGQSEMDKANTKISPEIEARKREIEEILNIGGEEEKQEEVVEGDEDDIEGVPTNELEEIGEEGGETDAQSGGGFTGGSVDGVKDPTRDIKKTLETSGKNNTEGNKKKSGMFSFLGFGKKKEDNNVISTRKDEIDLEPQEGYANIEGMFSGFGVDDAQDLSILPVKKDVNLKTRKKSKNKIIIVEKAVRDASSVGLSMPSKGSSVSIVQSTDEQKILMNMQSTSTLKYT